MANRSKRKKDQPEEPRMPDGPRTTWEDIVGPESREQMEQKKEKETLSQDPIEPKGGGLAGRFSGLKLIIFIVFGVWVLINAFHEPMLQSIGQFLVVSDEMEPSDLIVCLSGAAVERGLEAVDAYNKGLAPQVLIIREVPPDGYEALEKAGIDLPETIDIQRRVLTGMGVPEKDILAIGTPATSTWDEAGMVKALAVRSGFDSLILVTSPTHSRRAWFAFRKAMEDQEIEIRMLPSSYSGFRPDSWWKNRRYVREVIVEYQKLIYYWFQSL